MEFALSGNNIVGFKLYWEGIKVNKSSIFLKQELYDIISPSKGIPKIKVSVDKKTSISVTDIFSEEDFNKKSEKFKFKNRFMLSGNTKLIVEPDDEEIECFLKLIG